MKEITKVKPVQNRLLIPLIVVLLLLTSGFSTLLFITHKRSIEHLGQHIMEDATKSLQLSLARSARMLSTMEDILLQSRQLREPLRNRNREQLFALYDPIFQRLQKDYPISHFYFHTPDRVNIIRLHHPEKHGDHINRLTLREAERNGKMSWGVELGPLGTLTLRVVQPVYMDKTLIGYIELGQEIESILDLIHKRLGIEIAVTIHKKLLGRRQWESGMEMLDREALWDRYKDAVLTYYTLPSFPAESDPFIYSNENHRHDRFSDKIRFNNKSWQLISFDLKDMSGVEVGDLILLRDITDIQSDFTTLVSMTALFTMILVGGIIAFYYMIVRQTDRGIEKQHKTIIENEAKLLDAQRIARIGTWELNLLTNTLLWSGEIYKMSGLEPEQSCASYEDFLDIIHPDDREFVNKAYTESVANKTPYDIIHRLLLKDGTETIVSERCETLYDEDGKAVRSIGTVQDITEIKLAEQELRQNKEKYHNFLETTSEGFWMMNAEFSCIEVNDSLCRMLGYDKEEMLGLTPLDIVNEETRKTLTENISLIETTLHRRYELILKKKNGADLHVKIHSTTIRNRSGEVQGAFAFLSDITEELKLRAEYQQAQKMESVGRLAGGVAHDFNNMLGVILGHAQLALEQMDPTQPCHGNLLEIEKAAQRSADLTRQLLGFARKQAIAPRVLNTNDTVTGMITILTRLIGEDISLKWLPGMELWAVKIDPGQIDQILANLCVNARDAITGVGKITIETRNTSLDKNYCANHPGFTPGKFVMLSLSDDGHGIDKEIQLNIFDPFFTTKKLGEGTGLGLSMVYGIVKQNNGFLNVYSEPGQGTTFNIYLPRHVGQITVKEDRKHAEMVGGNETILLVEDDPALLESTRRMLENAGYRLLVAETPKKALEWASKSHQTIHLLLTDVIMPDTNGMDLSKQILQLNPKLKTMFMSGYTANVISHHGVLDEGANFIQKPFSREDLMAAVRGVLDQGPNQ